MTKNQKNNAVGDTLSPALRQNAESLRCAPDQGVQIHADAAPKPAPISAIGSFAASVKHTSKSNGPVGSCVQTLWFSFFFDGTGNNRDADEGTLKHSNVARLFRAMPVNDKDIGRYAFYIPGVGTYFKDIGDNGGTLRGFAFGNKGAERMQWALDQFDERMKFHIARANNPTNAIVEINIAAFGFSRGAALARAFIHNFVNNRCQRDSENICKLKSGNYKIRIRFMGLFDTVASVGAAMATNNTSYIGAIAGSVAYIIKSRLNDSEYASIRPERLAFAKNAQAGADPAPGTFNGHTDWGEDMLIPAMVEEVRHFVAAHEIRNSFPLDSISVLQKGRINKPAHFFETVYPGVHSDVGGSYRPGEGGRSDKSAQKLGLIPLSDMYKLALAKGVPLLPKTAWQNFNRDDFKEKGDHSEADHVKKNTAGFKSEERALNQEINDLEAKNNAAIQKLNVAQELRKVYINNNYGNPNIREGVADHDQKITAAQREQDATQDKLLRAKARLDAVPKTGSLQDMLELYDKQLLADARAIHDVCSRPPVGRTKPDPAIRNHLRPHYKGLMSAYENEYLHNKSLADETIIAFFDNYIHDSLAGFAKDATLPSDPRAIYLGGNEKYKYAKLDKENDVELAPAEIHAA